MGRPGPASQAKRSRERLRHERHQEKEGKREVRKELKKEREQLVADGIDPDLQGIVAGPQERSEE
jgi:hypothetical protein